MLGDKEAAEVFTEFGILPCPFCGGKATLKTQSVEYGLSGTIIKCESCLVIMFSPDKKAILKNDKLTNIPINNHMFIGIKKWNARPQLLTKEQIEALERMEKDRKDV